MLLMAKVGRLVWKMAEGNLVRVQLPLSLRDELVPLILPDERLLFVLKTDHVHDCTLLDSALREGFKNPRHGNFPLGGFPPPPRPRGLHGRDFPKKLADIS